MTRVLDKKVSPPPASSRRKAVPLVMGILNVTPDSFYAGSRAAGLDAAVELGLKLEAEGAQVLDVGGESTRPGADPASEQEEAGRVLPVLEALARKVSIPLSVDTYKASVARRARDAGASWLNDVSALRADRGMAKVAAGYDRCVLMHMLGDSPKTMQEAPRYKDVVEEVLSFFQERLEAFRRAGGDERKVYVDPGIGFGKDLEHNLELLRRLEELARRSGRPVVVGASRKSFIGRLLASEDAPAPVEDRLEGSLAVACRAAAAGAAVLRVHDVLATRRALAVFAAVAAMPAAEPRGPSGGAAPGARHG